MFNLLIQTLDLNCVNSQLLDISAKTKQKTYKKGILKSINKQGDSQIEESKI